MRSLRARGDVHAHARAFSTLVGGCTWRYQVERTEKKMCLAPVLVDGVSVWCRKCWQCRSARIDDYVGRAIAESLSSVGTNVVTLTYGRDADDRVMHNKAAKLEYRDVQGFLMRLRKAGFPCRYLAAGEYGGEFGRAHWHVVLNWTERVPWMPELEKRLDWNVVDAYTGEVLSDKQGNPRLFWPHGFVYVEKPEFKKLKYALKYALKNEENPMAENIFGFSSRPPLGDKYFRERARKMVFQGLAPNDAFYSFSNVKRKGVERKFLLRGKSLDNFLLEWKETWEAFRVGERFPESPFLEKWLDQRVAVRLRLEGKQRWRGARETKQIRKGEFDGTSMDPFYNETYTEFRLRKIREEEQRLARTKRTGRSKSGTR